jgi:hypothetical protein
VRLRSAGSLDALLGGLPEPMRRWLRKQQQAQVKQSTTRQR